MSYKTSALELVAAATLSLLVACQGASTLPPGPTSPFAPASDAEGAASTKAAEPSPQPAEDNPAGESPASASQHSSGEPQSQSAVFYEHNGLSLEYHWPLDDARNLSAYETEIIAYNAGDAAVEFVDPRMAFTEGGNARLQTSGTWEKFPSRDSWDRTEYISIPPSPYQGEPLRLDPGEKGKIHWHIDGVTSEETVQSAVLDLTVSMGLGTETIKKTLSRGSVLPESSAARAPEPAHEPAEAPPQSPSNDGPADAAGPAGTPAATVPAPTVSAESHEAYPLDSSPSDVMWTFDGSAWSPSGAAPSCADPFVLQTPVDMTKVTGALWPGQSRGGYKGHGGFAFDHSDAGEVIVRAPVSSHLVQASKYLEGDEEQILLFFSVPCGFFYRFDHVNGLSPKIADALASIPYPTTSDSRTTRLNPPLWLEQGEIVATSVGIPPSNIFVDFGLYNVRAPNNVKPNPAWADLFAADKEFGHYGVCFFDYLPGTDGATMRSLPTGIEGPVSDYCE